MKITVTSVLVDDQAKALSFYTHERALRRRRQPAVVSCPLVAAMCLAVSQ